MTTDARAKRQAEFLECVVELIRASAKHPDLRFGQLLVDALGRPAFDSTFLRDIECAEIARRVREFAEKAA